MAAVFLVAGIAWFIGGFILFPDAPIKPCGTGYCGKQHQAHSETDFERFTIWESTLQFGWPLVILAAWWVQRERKRAKSTN
jgi:hypothetical protein